MLTLVIAALTTVHVAAATPAAHRPVPAPVVVAEPTRAAEHIARARKALEAGELTEARREFVIASAISRDEGALPVESAVGLAQVLYAQFEEKAAARVLDELAEEAAARNDANVEARARADAVVLHVAMKQRNQARADASRLTELLERASLTAETRAYVATRVR